MALGSLEVELLSAILEYVNEESPRTMKSVSLVNKHLSATARRVRFRRQMLDFTDPVKARSRLSAYLAEPEALRSIRHLTIVGHRHRDLPQELSEIRSTCESLADLFRDLANLRSVFWRYAGPIPLVLLDAIHQYQPRAALSIYNWSREADDADQNDPAELALANSPTLKCLQASIWHGAGDSYPDLREAACKRIIANAPNLQYASVTTGRSGCVIRTLSVAEQAELAEKEEFFYIHKQPSRSLKALTLDGYGLSGQTLAQWRRFLDLSKLESLKCSRGFVPDKSYFTLAPELLTSLKHVSLNFTYNKNDADFAAAADNYLATCPPLETISLWSWMNVISLQSILKHGYTLKTLQLHERESLALDVPRDLLTASDVANIRRACPILQDFTMDVDREAAQWEEEVDNRATYSELSRFGSQLNRIQLYFNLGIAAQIADGQRLRSRGRASSALEDAGSLSDSDSKSGQEGLQAKRSKHSNGLSATEKAMLPLPSPKATSAHARSIWATIFGRRRTGDRALDIKIGEWERKMGTGFPANWVLWEQSNRSYLKLRPHERDDMLDEAVLTCQGGLEGMI
jgi:hypothetical protein